MGLESTRTITVSGSFPARTWAAIWLDRPHLLKPGDKVGEETFAVIREAMVATGTAAVSRLVPLPARARGGAGSARPPDRSLDTALTATRCGLRTTSFRRRRRRRRS